MTDINVDDIVALIVQRAQESERSGDMVRDIYAAIMLVNLKVGEVMKRIREDERRSKA